MVDDLLSRFAAPFQQLALPYMITGGAAAIVYGEPRLTNDLDLVVAMKPADASRVAAALAAADTYVPPVEVLEIEAARPVHGHFNVVHGPSSLRADVYLAGEDPLNIWGLLHRKELLLADQTISIAPPEFVIVRKLQYAKMGGGDRHLRDIRRMLDRAVVPIDRTVIQRECRVYGLEEMWIRATKWSEPV